MKIQALKDLPTIKAGEFLTVIAKRFEGQPDCFWYEGRSVDKSYFMQHPDFFRLIEEPELKFGRAIKDEKPGDFEIKQGVIYPLSTYNEEYYLIEMIGHEVLWRKSSFTPSTEEEYLKQEESKKPWRPDKNGTPFYYVDEIGRFYLDQLQLGNNWQAKIFETGNCFRTEAAAQHFRDNYLKPAFEKYASEYSTLPAEVK